MGIYIFKHTLSNWIKIGFTKFSNPYDRIKGNHFNDIICPVDIKYTLCKDNLELFFWMAKLTHTHEQQLHNHFNNIRTGEWYKIHDLHIILDFLNNFIKNFNFLIEEEEDNIEENIFNMNINFFDNDKINLLFLESISKSESKISNFIFHLLQQNNSYFCTEDNIWYKFDNNKWSISNDIYLFIIDSVPEYYYKLIGLLKNKLLIEKINKIIKKFNDKTQFSKILNQLELRFKTANINSNFINLLDNKPYLIGFNNGTYDLKTLLFRPSIPEDMITLSVGYNFTEKYSEHREDLLKFLEDILPIEEDREYFLKYLSASLIGRNECELFTILSGKGRNGKSKLVELISLTFGDYFDSPKCKFLTSTKLNENSPDPILLSLKKKKIIICSESEKKDKLNSGFIKFITGNDTCNFRLCHKNEMLKFKANFITFLVCNDTPEIDELDKTLINRLRCINFPNEFVDDPKLPNQKLINKKLQEKLPLWKEDFMLLLLEYYIKYKENDLEAPENVLKWTNIYKEDNNKYLTFLNNCTEDSKTHIFSTTLYEVFKIWYKENYPTDKIPNKKDLLKEIKKYKEYSESLRVDSKTSSGFKNINIKQEYCNYFK